MGHQHLLTLPKSRDWQDVVKLIADGASVATIASATTKAANRTMIDASDDAGVRQSFFLLTQIPQAARSNDFANALRQLGLEVDDKPTLVGICAAMMESIDRFVLRPDRRTDLGEIAQLASVESLHAIAGRELPDLFGADATRTREAISKLGNGNQFAVLARDFFARLIRRHLYFYLDRELSSHVGRDRRFATYWERTAFEEALVTHCREASRIIKEFAEQWYGKHVAQGGIDQDKSGAFVAVASRKIRDELIARAPANA